MGQAAFIRPSHDLLVGLFHAKKILSERRG
jgi:hypothetical protein